MSQIDREKAKKEIVIALTNAYYEDYRYERPNDTHEQLGAFCRDLAENELEELLTLDRAALKQELKQSLEAEADDHYNGFGKVVTLEAINTVFNNSSSRMGGGEDV